MVRANSMVWPWNGDMSRRWQRILAGIALLVILVVGSTARAATFTWDGSGSGNGAIWDVASNWGGTLPSTTGDTLLFNGANSPYTGGVLSLVYSKAAWTGAAGQAGLNLHLTSLQTSSLTLTAGTISGLRFYNITLDPSSGALTLGGGATALNFSLGNAQTTPTWINNSANAATVSSNVAFSTGGASNETLILGGSGNWNFNTNVFSSNSVLSLAQSGAGTTTLASSDTLSGTSTVYLGKLVLGNTASLLNSTFDASGTGALSFGGLTSATFGGLQGASSGAALSLTNTNTVAINLSVGNNGGSTTFSGQLTGSNGTLTKIGNGALTMAGTTSYTGGTVVSGGILVYTGTGVIPTSGQITTGPAGAVAATPFWASGASTPLGDWLASGKLSTASSGALALTSGASDNEPLSLGSYSTLSIGAVAGGSATYGGSLTPSGTTYYLGGGGGQLTITAPLTGANGLVAGNGGGGTVILTTSNNYSGSTIVSAGVLQISNTNSLGTQGVAGVSGSGGLGWSGTNTLNLAGNNTLGSLYVNSGAVTISGSTTLTAAGNGGNANLNVGTGSLGVGVVNLVPGGVLTATNTSGWNIGLGEVTGGYGAMNVSGGTVNAWEIEVGNNGYGLYSQTGGVVNVSTWFLLARGGTANVTPYGVADISGGTLNNSGGTAMTLTDNWQGLGGSVNVRGSGMLNLGASNSFNVGGSGIGGVVNLLTGGTLETSAVKNNNGSGAFNFNGGLLVATTNSTGFMPAGTAYNAYIYPSGGTINTNGFNITLAHNLLSPSGSGISAISVTGSGYSSPPLVYVSGDGGTFATGLASIDGNGNITGITITNAGVGYTSSSGTAVQLLGGGGTYSITGVTLAANTTGNLLASGGGTLTLTGSNTFAGQASVATGTTLVLASSTALLGSTLNTGGGGTVLLSGTNIGIAEFAGAGSFALANTAGGGVLLNVGGDNSTLTYGGAFTGSTGTLAKVGTGAWTVSGANTSGGGTQVNGGLLAFGSTGAIPASGTITPGLSGALVATPFWASGTTSPLGDWLASGKVNTASSGTLALTAGVNDSESLSLTSYPTLSVGAAAGGSATYAGTLTTAANGYLGGGGGTLTVTQPVSTGNLTIGNGGGGTAILQGSVTVSGTTNINSGSLILSGANNLTGPIVFNANNTTLVVANDSALSGLNSTSVGLNLGAITGTVVDLATDGGESGVFMTAGTGFNTTILVDLNTTGPGINHTTGNMTLGGGTLNVASGSSVISSAGTLTIPKITLNSGTAGTVMLLNPTTANVSLGGVGNTAHSHTMGLGGTSVGNVVTGAIADGGGFPISLLKSGTGSWTLLGVNTYTGSTMITGGTLDASLSTLGSSTTATVLQVNNQNSGSNVLLLLPTGQDTTVGSLVSAISGANTATIQLGGTGINFNINQTTAATYAGSLIGSGNFNLGFASTSTLTLSGSNSFAGNTTINAGGLVLNYTTNNNVKLGGASFSLTMNGGSLTLAGGTTTEQFASTTFSGNTVTIAGTAGASILGLGTINDNTGSIVNLSAGSIATTTYVAGGGGLDLLPPNIEVGGQAAQVLPNGYITPIPLTGFAASNSSTTNVLLVGSGTAANGQAANLLQISTSGAGQSLNLGTDNQKYGITTGSLYFVGSNNYTIGGGSLSGGAVGSSSGTLQVFANGTGLLTIQSMIVDDGPNGLSKFGAGTVALAGSNSYSGPTLVQNGTLQLTSSGALGNSMAGTVSAGATLDVRANVASTGMLWTITGSGVSNAGAVIASNAVTFPLPVTLSGNASVGGSSSLNLSGAVTSSGFSLTKAGSGMLILSGFNALDSSLGVTMSAGTLVLGNDYGFSTSGLSGAPVNITSTSGAVLDLATDGQEPPSNINPAGSLTILSDREAVTSGANHTVGTVSMNPGTITVASGPNVNNSGGTLTINQLNERNGTSALYTLNPTTAVLSIGSIELGFDHSANTLALGGTSLGNVVTGTISSPNSPGNKANHLVMNGAGSWTLAGFNTFGSLSGGTNDVTVSSGTLTIAGGNVYTSNTNVGTGGAGSAVLVVAAGNALGTGTVQFDPQGNGTQARMDLMGGFENDNPITLTARNTNTVAVENLSGSNTLGGQMTLAVGGSNYWIQSDADLLTLSGGTAITLGAGVTGTRTVKFLGAGNDLVSGSLADGDSGLLAITMAGSGMLTLSGNNTYTGLTEDLSGELVLETSTAIASGDALIVGTNAANLGASLSLAEQSARGSPISVVATVPEPGTLALLAAGAAVALLAFRRRRSGASAA